MGQKDDWKPTREHLKIFKAYVEKWQKEFGLFDWDIDVSRMDLGEDSGACAAAYTDVEARMAEIILNTTWNLRPTNELLNQAAFHEVCEILIEPLRYLVRKKGKHSDERIASVVHSIIRRLEHVCL